MSLCAIKGYEKDFLGDIYYAILRGKSDSFLMFMFICQSDIHLPKCSMDIGADSIQFFFLVMVRIIFLLYFFFCTSRFSCSAFSVCKAGSFQSQDFSFRNFMADS